MRPLVVLGLLALSAAAQPDYGGPGPSRSEVVIRGRISRIALGMMQGMPSMEVASDGRAWKVWLGSMRYLIENGFNPKAGQHVVIRAFRPVGDSNELWAISVTIADTRQTIRLRDQAGRPIWRRAGPGRRGRGLGKSF